MGPGSASRHSVPRRVRDTEYGLNTKSRSPDAAQRAAPAAWCAADPGSTKVKGSHGQFPVPHRRAHSEAFGRIDDGVSVDAVVAIAVVDGAGLATPGPPYISS